MSGPSCLGLMFRRPDMTMGVPVRARRREDAVR
jgi:hypothetical protein